MSDAQIPEQSPEFRRRLNQSARMLRANRPGEAVELLSTLHAEHPTNPDVAINFGGALILQRKWDRAVRVLKTAAQAHPRHPMLWTNLAAAYLGRLETAGPKQQRRAISAYEKALAADPKTPNVHYHLGLIHKEQGQLEKARQYFRQALTVDPADKDARHWLDRLTAIEEENREEPEQDDEAPSGGTA